MKYWRARDIRRYDMGGGGEYKKKFGGYDIVVPWIRKSKYPGVSAARQFVKQVFQWRQKWLGKTERLVDRWS